MQSINAWDVNEGAHNDGAGCSAGVVRLSEGGRETYTRHLYRWAVPRHGGR